MFPLFKLLESNPALGLKDDVYQDTSKLIRDSHLSNYLQVATSTIFANANDRSLFSIDIEKQLTTDALVSALSSERFQYISIFNFNNISHVLDLSQDFGGVSHYLADRSNTVEAVYIDIDHARLAKTRCANKKNVCHITQDLTLLNLPENHYDLIILPALDLLKLTQEALNTLLQKLHQALSPNGVLTINVLNQGRISRTFNSFTTTEANGLPFAELYRNANTDNIVTEKNRQQFRCLLKNLGFTGVDFHACFTPGFRVSHLFSEDYLTSSVNALNHFYRLGGLDNNQISEFLLFQNLVDQQHNLTDLAHRFVVFAGKSTSTVKQLYNNDFTYFPSRSRFPYWRTVTSRAHSAVNVEKTPLHSGVTKPETGLVQQNLAARSFHKGHLLIEDWLSAIHQKDHHRFAELVSEYQQWLNDNIHHSELQTLAYDLLPFNLIINERGGRSLLPIDKEWHIDTKLNAEFILFRALFWFAIENQAVLAPYALQNDLATVGAFVIAYMDKRHLVSDLTDFVTLEESIQHEIVKPDSRHGSIRGALEQSFDDFLNSNRPKPRRLSITWVTGDGEPDTTSEVTSAWELSSDVQQINLAVAPFKSGYQQLAIRQLDELGAFCLHEVKLLDHNDKVIHTWAVAASTVSTLENPESASWSEPISDIKGIESVSQARLKLSWLWQRPGSQEINALSQALVNHQNNLIHQSHRLNQYRAELEYKSSRMEDLLRDRQELTKTLEEVKESKAIQELKARLHAQEQRNDELHHYLLMRPSTRFKRVAKRWLTKLGRTPDAEATDTQSNIQEVKEQSSLPTGELIGQNTEDYAQWVRENIVSDAQVEQAHTDIANMAHKPVFSILVPIYNTDPEYLIPMIRSVQAQIYPHWELCLVDDCSPKSYLRNILEHEAERDSRIKVRLNDVNQGISVTTNDALELASGDYIALLDHDDEISIDALYENAKVINQNPEADLIYSDEDKMDMQGNRLEPYFKPDYSPDLLHTNNYICHFTVIKKSIIDDIGGFREGLDGSQDHDIILRATAVAKDVVHIPKILYHWRKIPGSTAVVYDSKSYAWEAGRRAVEDCLQRKESSDTKVEFGSLKGTYRVFREIKGTPLVSIIIPFKDKPELLSTCIHSIIDRSTYENIEIIGVSNNSEQDDTKTCMQHLAELDKRVRFVEKNIPFNFSEICNYGVEQSQGEYIILLNNDIEIINADWIEQLLQHAQREEIGAVGGKLLYPDGRIQHAGVVAGMVGAAGHPHKFFPDDHIGYHGRLHMVYNVSAVTGALLMVNKNKYQEVGGLDEDNLAVAYNDVDFCLKLLEKDYYNVFTPHAKATHHESVSRGYEDTDEKMQRLLKEQSHFLATWADFLEQGDPYYNPNLSLKNERFSLKFRD